MASVMDFLINPGGQPPAVALGNLALDRDDALVDLSTARGIGERMFRTRTIPDIGSRRAARGGFFSGHTTKEMARAGEDFGIDMGQLETQVQRQLLGIARNMYGVSMGIPLGR